MLKIENHMGKIEVTNAYFSALLGHAVSECFGVAGLVHTTPVQGLRALLLRRDEKGGRGVRVRTVGGALAIELHIAVTYGVNISAIVKSIINKVTYTVEAACGITVGKVDVMVVEMK